MSRTVSTYLRESSGVLGVRVVRRGSSAIVKVSTSVVEVGKALTDK